MNEMCDVVIIGAGQAGLSMSHELSRMNRDHIILERGRTGQTWRGRWDSFCLVLPNWTIKLAGAPYRGPDPDGFMNSRRVCGAYVWLRRILQCPGARGSRGCNHSSGGTMAGSC